MDRLRILADDLTGALDSAAAFADGASVPVYLAAPGDAPGPAPVAAAWATDSRDVPCAELPQRLAVAGPWLADADLSFKKVDSLLRGNSLAEVAELLRQGHFDRVVFAPAYPAQGRCTVDGRQWAVDVNGVRRSVGPGSLIDAFAALGVGAARSATPPRASEAPVWIPDVCEETDLARIVAMRPHLGAQRWLWCGSAGLAFALARAVKTPRIAEVSPPDTHMPTLVLTASHHPVLRAQLRCLQARGVGEVWAAPQGDAALRDSVRCLRAGRHVVLDVSWREPVSAELAAATLRQQMAQLIKLLPTPARLLVIGGDTLLALCRAAGTRVLHAHAAPRPGWGLARLEGGRWDGAMCLSRSGAFGAEDDLLNAIAPGPAPALH